MLPSRAALASNIPCRWLPLAGEGKLWAFTTSAQIHKYIQISEANAAYGQIQSVFFFPHTTIPRYHSELGLYIPFIYLCRSHKIGFACPPPLTRFSSTETLQGNICVTWLALQMPGASAPHCKFTANPRKIKSRRYLINCELRDKWRIKGRNWRVIKKFTGDNLNQKLSADNKCAKEPQSQEAGACLTQWPAYPVCSRELVQERDGGTTRILMFRAWWSSERQAFKVLVIYS